MVLRDRDADTDWDAASDGTLEERVYYVQNWRADVSVLLDDAGTILERVKYDAYGTPILHPSDDVNADGAVTSQDQTDFVNVYTTAISYKKTCDLDCDGDVDNDDGTIFFAAFSDASTNAGRGRLSRSDLGNRKGYAGYENDGAVTKLWHARNRVLDSTLGRWTRRDPLGYVDGASLFQYTASPPVVNSDSSGLHLCQGCKKKHPTNIAKCRNCCWTDPQYSAPGCRSTCLYSCSPPPPPPPLPPPPPPFAPGIPDDPPWTPAPGRPREPEYNCCINKCSAVLQIWKGLCLSCDLKKIHELHRKCGSGVHGMHYRMWQQG